MEAIVNEQSASLQVQYEGDIQVIGDHAYVTLNRADNDECWNVIFKVPGYRIHDPGHPGDDEMIAAFTANRSDQPLDVRVLPR